MRLICHQIWQLQYIIFSSAKWKTHSVHNYTVFLCFYFSFSSSTFPYFLLLLRIFYLHSQSFFLFTSSFFLSLFFFTPSFFDFSSINTSSHFFLLPSFIIFFSASSFLLHPFPLISLLPFPLFYTKLHFRIFSPSSSSSHSYSAKRGNHFFFVWVAIKEWIAGQNFKSAWIKTIKKIFYTYIFLKFIFRLFLTFKYICAFLKEFFFPTHLVAMVTIHSCIIYNKIQ